MLSARTLSRSWGRTAPSPLTPAAFYPTLTHNGRPRSCARRTQTTRMSLTCSRMTSPMTLTTSTTTTTSPSVRRAPTSTRCAVSLLHHHHHQTPHLRVTFCKLTP
jgi:hypothetical protein